MPRAVNQEVNVRTRGTRALDQATAAVGDLGKGLGGLAAAGPLKGLLALTGGLGGVANAGRAAAGGIAAVGVAVEGMAELNRQAERLGLSVAQLRGLERVAFVRSARDAEELRDAISDLNERVGEAQEGWNGWTEQLLRYGVISGEVEAKSLSTREALRRILEVAATQNRSQRTFFLEDVAPNLSRIVRTADDAREALFALGTEDRALDSLAADAEELSRTFREWGRDILDGAGDALAALGVGIADLFNAAQRESRRAVDDLGSDSVLREWDRVTARIAELHAELEGKLDEEGGILFGGHQTANALGELAGLQERLVGLARRRGEQATEAAEAARREQDANEALAKSLGVSLDTLGDYGRLTQQFLQGERERAKQLESLTSLLRRARAGEIELGDASVERLQKLVDGLSGAAAARREEAAAAETQRRADEAADREDERRLASAGRAARSLRQISRGIDAELSRLGGDETAVRRARVDERARALADELVAIAKANPALAETLRLQEAIANVEVLRLAQQQEITDAIATANGEWLAAAAEDLATYRDEYSRTFAEIGASVSGAFARMRDAGSEWWAELLGALPDIVALFQQLRQAQAGFDGANNRIAAYNFAAPLARRQFGGLVGAGVPYLVGEAGPEPFVPFQRGYVLPGAALRGGTTIHNEIHVSTPVTVATPGGAAPVLDARALALEVTRIQRQQYG